MLETYFLGQGGGNQDLFQTIKYHIDVFYFLLKSWEEEFLLFPAFLFFLPGIGSRKEENFQFYLPLRTSNGQCLINYLETMAFQKSSLDSKTTK